MALVTIGHLPIATVAWIASQLSSPTAARSAVDARIRDQAESMIGEAISSNPAVTSAVISAINSNPDILADLAWSQGNIAASDDYRELPLGAHTVASPSAGLQIGLPVSRRGSLEILRGSNIGARIARFTTTHESEALPLQVWETASTSEGVWSGTWERVFPLADEVFERLSWWKGNIAASDDYRTLDYGNHTVASPSAGLQIGLPVSRRGSLEILRSSQLEAKIARFTTTREGSEPLEIWATASTSEGVWSGTWEKLWPLDLDLTGYATQQDLADAIDDLPTPLSAFGVDPDGVPYILIGE